MTQPNSGPATARNTGVFATRGKFLLFTYNDCTVVADWLQNLENRFICRNTRLLNRRLNCKRAAG
ncbi:glycosyltransferase family 2 protein [Microcoleus vaginatus GB1-A2]